VSGGRGLHELADPAPATPPTEANLSGGSGILRGLDRRGHIMAANDPRIASQQGALTSLPRLEDIRRAPGGGYDADSVREAFDAYRRHALQLQAQLRVLQAAGSTASVEPSGHAVRMDALHLIRAAAEFADAMERDAQNAASTQITRTVSELRKRQQELMARETAVDQYRDESERWRNDILKAAKDEARELLVTASRDATAELHEAEARGANLLEQARHQATELTNAARAEIEQTLVWARGEGLTIIARAQQGAEQLLTAAGLGPEALATVTATFLESIRGAEQPSAADGPPRIASAPGPMASDHPAADHPAADHGAPNRGAAERMASGHVDRGAPDSQPLASGRGPSEHVPFEPIALEPLAFELVASEPADPPSSPVVGPQDEEEL